MEYDEALNNIKKSFQADIDSGFTFLHIDPTFDLSETLTTSQVLTRVKELYEFCFNYAQKNDKDIDFEISIWEDGSSVKENDDVDFVADAPKCANFCARKLGWPVLDVELQDENFFTAFEEAVTTYGNAAVIS